MKNIDDRSVIVGFESSCDETAVAFVRGREVLSSIVASQHDIHSKFGGVVPELASRRHVEAVIPVFEEALHAADIGLADIEGVAVTRSPGLIGALLVGLSAAKALAFSLNVPLIGVNHLEGHLSAAHLEFPDISYPHIGLIVSGGHTSLYLVEAFGKYRLLGSTRDDAAGEAFDKVARLLGLGYPGGPIIDARAVNGNPKAFKFKTPKFKGGCELDFSFSGLKTAVMLYYKELVAKGNLTEKNIDDLIASFQSKAVDMLVENIVRAAKKYKCRSAVISGGVAANKGLRERLCEVGAKEKLEIFIPPMHHCTDNGAMIAYVGSRRLILGERSGLDLNAVAVDEIGINSPPCRGCC